MATGIIEAWEAMQPADGDGMTAREIAKAHGISVRRTRRILAELRQAGRLELDWRVTERIDGRKNKTPVYRVLPEEKSPTG